jgi:hypothetical protein
MPQKRPDGATRTEPVWPVGGLVEHFSGLAKLMLNKSSAGRVGRTAAVCWGLAVLALATQPAWAEDDLTFEQGIIQSLLGRGGPSIDYRERSPLVIPPSTELPPPDSRGVAAATPNWPHDPDAARRRNASNEGPVTDPFERADRPLSPGELRRGTTRGARSNAPVRTLSDSELGRTLTPSELGGKTLLGGLFSGSSSSDKPVAFAGEPTRSKLIDPPAGYRTPAPTQPYAPPKSEGVWYKPSSWFDRGLERN